MIGYLLLVLGLGLWVSAHVFKRAAPAQRATLEAWMGEGARGIFAVLILAGLVLMVVGWRAIGPMDYVFLWAAPPWFGHVNNLAMLVAFYVFGIGMAKGALSQKIRHPMLLGVLIWALAHLAVNGDLAGLILFGGMAAWSVAAMALINARAPSWVPPARKSGPRDAVAAGVVLVVYGVVGLIHNWLGVNPFGSLGA
ncbi:MAG: NnrU family protein [Alkalilacustris sp.]